MPSLWLKPKSTRIKISQFQVVSLRSWSCCALMVFVFLLFWVSSLRGQVYPIKIVDSKSGKAISFAHVCFESLLSGKVITGITNEEGITDNPVSNISKLGISYVGYETFIDTITPGESNTYQLVPTILNIDEVVVTAQYTPERADRSIYKLKVINSQQIEQKAAVNLNELLGTELNIRTTQDAFLGAGLSLQGLSGEHVKFLVDGVPVIGRLNGTIDMNQLNLYNVDHIEIIEGPMSVVYGSNAMAGVVNIITRENKNYRSYTSLNGYTESVGVYNVDGSTSLRYGDHIFQVSGGRNFFSGYSENDTSRAKQWKPKRQYFIDGSYILDRQKLKLKYATSYFNEKLQSKGNLKAPYYEKAFDNYFNTVRFTNKLDASIKLPSNRYLNILSAYSIFDRRKEEFYKDMTSLEQTLVDEDTTIFYSFMTRATYSKSNQNGKFNYQLGVDLNYEKGKGGKIENAVQQIGDYAAFLSVMYKPWQRLLLQPGLRYIYNTKYSAPLVYSFNVKYDPVDRLSLRASYAKGFRSPSLKELYLYFVDVNHRVYGNPDLMAESSHNVNFSMLYYADRDQHVYEAEGVFFYNNIKNSIILVIVDDDDSPPPYRYENLGRYQTKGFLVSLNYRFYPNLNFKTGVVHTISTILKSEGQTNQNASSTDVNTSLNYKLIGQDITFSLFYKYNGKLPYFYIDTDDEVMLKTMADFHTLDFTISKSFFQNSLFVAAGVKNILNNQSVLLSGGNNGGVHTGGDSSIVGWGRSWFIMASYTIKYLK